MSHQHIVCCDIQPTPGGANKYLLLSAQKYILGFIEVLPHGGLKTIRAMNSNLSVEAIHRIGKFAGLSYIAPQDWLQHALEYHYAAD